MLEMLQNIYRKTFYKIVNGKQPTSSLITPILSSSLIRKNVEFAEHRVCSTRPRVNPSLGTFVVHAFRLIEDT